MSDFFVKQCKHFPQDVVYVLGGGSSLQGFDFEQLKNKFVIGCNDAYQLGSEIVEITVFGDTSWWKHHREQLKFYNGLVVTNKTSKGEWSQLNIMKRLSNEISDEDGKLGWFGNTGVSAFNLALLFGAHTVYLLGFDMKVCDRTGTANWHPNELSKPKAAHYNKFMKKWEMAARQAAEKFPEVEVYNANLDSQMTLFPKIPREEAVA